MVELEFEEMPSLMGAYARVLKPSKKYFNPNKSIPRFEAKISGLRVDRKNLDLFGRVCGVALNGSLPPTYPHVMAGALHAQIVTHPEFPLGALGLVHVRNQIRYLREMPADGAWDVVVSVEGHREVSAGIEFDILTDFSADGERVWEQTTTAIYRIGEKKDKSKSKPKPHESGAFKALKRSATWQVREDAGRQYARVSGDYNPIHLQALAARAFGFKRAIATGMWSVARAGAELDGDLPRPPYVLNVAFKRPIYLPSRVVFSSWEERGETKFMVESLDGRTLHLEGDIGLPS